jgi:hypothetical protein
VGRRTPHKDGLCPICRVAPKLKTKDGYCRPCGREKRKAWNRANRDHVRIAKRASFFRISYELAARLAAQKVCDVCAAEGPTVIDHDHSTGEIRGVLCHPCNLFLGKLERRLGDGTVQKLLEYIGKAL